MYKLKSVFLDTLVISDLNSYMGILVLIYFLKASILCLNFTGPLKFPSGHRELCVYKGQACQGLLYWLECPPVQTSATYLFFFSFSFF